MSNLHQLQWDDTLFQAKIRKMAKRLKVDETAFVREQSGFLLRDITRYVPPYKKFPRLKSTSMGSKQDQIQGQNAIKSDLNRLFFVPDDGKVYEWAKSEFAPGQPIYSGKKITGAGVARTLRDMEQHHRRHSNRRGRAYRLNGPERLWTSRTLYNQYFKSLSAHIGTAKAAVAKAGTQLHRKLKVPAWIRKQFIRANGRGYMLQQRGAPAAIFKIRAYGLQHIQPKTLTLLKQIRLRDMERRLKMMMRSIAKKSGFKSTT